MKTVFTLAVRFTHSVRFMTSACLMRGVLFSRTSGQGDLRGVPVIALGILSALALAVACSGDDSKTRDDYLPGTGTGSSGGSHGLGGQGGEQTGGAGAADSQGSGGDGQVIPPLTPSMGPCRDLICSAGQECFVGVDSQAAMCRCKLGFAGPNCEDIDECQNGNPCDENAACFNYPGGFFCECGPGFTGSGNLCENVNECQSGSSGCDDGATCSDHVGSYSCSCGAGTSGDGVLCQAEDACETSPCSQGACLSTESAFVCTCEPGSTGTTCEQSCGDLSVEDSKLDQAIRDLLKLTPLDAITQELMSGVKQLSFPQRGITSLAGLECWPGLESLNVSDNEISDLSSLSPLTGLKALNVSCNPFDSLEPLNQLVGLTRLEIKGCESGPSLSNADLDALASLRHLRELWLTRLGLSSVVPLSSLKALQILELGDNQLSSLAGLEVLQRLRTLGVSGNQLTSLLGIGGHESLVTLVASRNQIADLASIKDFSGLTRLYLDQNELSELEALSGFAKLRFLHLEGNQIGDVSPLAGLSGLAQLKLNGNLVEDLSPFSASSRFAPDWELDLRANPISCGDQSSHLDALILRGVSVYVSCL